MKCEIIIGPDNQKYRIKSNGKIIADTLTGLKVTQEEAEINAAHIVKCVNNYNGLLAALKDVVNEYAIFANVPENYKELTGWPGDENPRTVAMAKAMEAIQTAEKK